MRISREHFGSTSLDAFLHTEQHSAIHDEAYRLGHVGSELEATPQVTGAARSKAADEACISVGKRFQVKDNLSIIAGRHTVKAGGEWIHTNNFQVFRGFFEGRYIFDSVSGFLRYASPAAPGGFGP